MGISMEITMLLKANMKKYKGRLFGIFFLMLLVAAAVGTVLTVWFNSGPYIREEIQRAGFGDLTAWVSGDFEGSGLIGRMEGLPEMERVELQHLIYANYTAGGQESDSEGQLILYRPEEGRYRFFADDLSGYKEQPEEIVRGEVYVSPSMVSMLGIRIGDEITFPIARSGRNLVLTVKGFYEDPFMGSSMIGMKGFLISEADREEALSVLKSAGIDALARDGAMLHIFSAREGLTVSELNSILNEQAGLSEYSEDVHSKDAIAGFMVVLQNAFGGLLLAFALVLLFAVLVTISHSINSTIEADTENMGILKTIGFTSAKLKLLQLYQYLLPILAGMLLGLLFSVPCSSFISSAILMTMGVRMPVGLPPIWTALTFLGMLLLLLGFVMLRMGNIGRIKPVQAIRSAAETVRIHPERTISAYGGCLQLRLAFRQLLAGKHRYIGALIVAVLLTFFASLVGRMDAWLGSDGKGMMDAFNPADHDLGVQSFGTLTREEFEHTIRLYTDITDTYALAMPSVAVNGVDYTANVIDQPERFHIIEGRACIAANEIVLTEFVAADFGISVGDTVTVRGDRGSSDYIVSGIYSCANDMGDNVGMNREGYLKIGRDHPNLWCFHYFLADASKKTEIAEALEHAYGGDVHVHENTWPGLFGIISAMQALIILMYSMVAIFILVVTVMTGNQILSAEQHDLGIYKTIGFSSNRLRWTFALRFGMVALLGSILGIAFAAVFTDPLVSAVMKLAGISNFASSLGIGSILLPAGAVIFLFTGFAYIAAAKVKIFERGMMMKKNGWKSISMMFVFVFAAAMLLYGCGSPDKKEEQEQGTPLITGNQSQEKEQDNVDDNMDADEDSAADSLATTELEVCFGDRGEAFILHLYDNDTAAAIARHVGTANWRLPIYHYDDYDNWEVMQYYDIPSRYDIPSDSESITSEKAGEVYYSEPNRIVLFFGDAEVAGEYTKVGYFDFTEEFKAAVENNPVLEGWGNKIVLINSAK